jgi:exodeoxyribonuclease V alpha subunit
MTAVSTQPSAGDKVMQIENNYGKDVYNGDIGFVAGIDLDEQELSVSFDGRTVRYAFGELNELVLCYATTIHKSQGSEYPAVVIPLSTQHYIMLKRNLVYTGITRGKRLVVLVGQDLSGIDRNHFGTWIALDLVESIRPLNPAR